jgi:hypothetical protein
MVVTVKFVVVWVVTRFNRDDGGSIFLSNVGIHLKTTRRHNLDRQNSVVLVRKRTIPTERQQPVGEVSAKFS